MIWSHSRISLYHSCPFAWRLKYIDKVPEAQNERFLIGRRFHQAVAEYAKRCLTMKRETDWDFGRQLTARYADSRDVATALERFTQNYLFDWRHVVGIEERLEASLPSGERFQGIIDCLSIVDNEAHIMDWKTQAALPAQTDDPPIQLMRYAWLVQQVYPQVSAFRLAYYYTRFNIEHEWEIEGALSADEIDEAVKYIIKAVERGEFEPTPSSWCSLCGYTSSCPVTEAAFPEGDIVKAAEKFVVLEAELGRLRKLLREWTNENGPIQINDVEIGFHLPDSKPRPQSKEQVAGFIEWASREGVDWHDVIRIDARAFDKLHKHYGEAIPAELLSFPKPRPTFGSRRVKEA